MGAKDMSGLRFGRLVVLERAGTRSKNPIWRCRCDCGNEIFAMGGNLRSGDTQSCGCLNRENAKKRYLTHGGTNTRLFRIWHNMKNRCGNPNTKDYADYGSRGIKVCPEWSENFEAFRDWAMANGYREDLTLDRKDNDGPYSPENCRWITNAAQQNNRRNNHLLTLYGKTQTITKWAEETGINRSTLKARLKRGWSIEKALTYPVGKERE